MSNENVMFNHEQKQSYIEYEKINKQALTGCFKRISKGEELYSKDIAEMNENELKNTLINQNIRREDTRSQLISLLRGYINWARLNGKTVNNSAIFKITPESISSIEAVAQQMIKDPDQVEHILSISINTDKKMFEAGGYYKQENRANRDRLVFWLIYSGLFIKDLIELKKCDLNYKNKTIIGRNGVIYEIDDKVLSLWNAYSNAKYIEKAGTRSKNKDFLSSDLLDNDLLFRNTVKKNGKGKNNQDYNSLAKILDKIFMLYSEATKNVIDILPDNVRASGIFYKLFLREKNGEIIAPEILAKYFCRDYNGKQSPSFFSTVRKWQIDYEDWKVAFGYM